MDALSKTINPQTGKVFPLRVVLKVVDYSSAAWYGKLAQTTEVIVQKGPKPFLNNDQALTAIKDEIKHSRFHAEGYVKITKRLKRKGIIIAKNRVNRLLRENNLLSANRPIKQGARRKHDGTIITQKPNELWATDGKQFYTEKEGLCWIWSVIDHFNDEILGQFICKSGDRFAAIEPVRQAVKKEFGAVDYQVCKHTKLALRSDHGSQYDSKDFVKEMQFLGLTESKSFVRSPECNGIIERWHRTLNEQVIAVNAFESLEQATPIIEQFTRNYNQEWLLHRLGLQSPTEAKINYNNHLKKCA